MTVSTRPLAILGLLAALAPIGAHAEGLYAGLDLSLPRVEDEVGDSISPKNIQGRFGYDFSDYIGLETRGSFTLFRDSFAGGDWSTAIVGVYGKAGVPLTDSIDVYVLGGFSSVSVAVDVNNTTATDDESGSSWGAGVDVALDRNRDITFCYMNYLEKDGIFTEVTGVDVGMTWHF